MYTVFFLDRNGNRYDFCQFAPLYEDTFLGKLEEVLYIMQELKPCHRGWQHDLASTGSCVFAYAGVELVTVEYDWHGSTIIVRDC
jgi:hypothetical protein